MQKFERAEFEVKEYVESEHYGKFVFEPLERGFGTTIGNALRRVLLSSLPGAAVFAIKMDGVYHEFTAIPGVVANVIFLFKESSVVSAIALADVMYMAKDLIGMYYSTYESLFMLVVAYLVILLPISIFGTWLERRFDYERR